MNVPETIKSKLGAKLHLRTDHPIGIAKRLMLAALPGFKVFEDLPSTVSVRDNFDLLRIPQDHPSRRTSDTYYIDDGHVLRTHTSAHQIELLRAGHERFIVVGDVYRKDDIDQTHYPIFHQMEGVALVENPAEDLRRSLFAAH